MKENQNNINPMANAIGLINQISKNSIAEMSNQLIDMVESGEINPLLLKVKLKAIKEIIEKVEGRILEHSINEAIKYKGQDFENCKIEIRNSGDRLQYDEDSTYSEIKSKLKQREELLKLAYKQRGTIIFDEEGIEIPVVSVLSGKENIYITIK